MVWLEVPLHGARVDLRVLVTDLAGKQRRGTAHDRSLLLGRAVYAPAALGLIDVALTSTTP